MLDDNLNKKKLTEIIGGQRFETEEAFQKYMRPKVEESLALEADRIERVMAKADARFDFIIYDSLTKREALLVMGLKTVAKSPTLSVQDIEKFHTKCIEMGTPYSVLMTEAEIHFYEYKEGLINEIQEIQPLNYIDYEFNRVMTKQKWRDLAITYKKYIVIGGILLFMLLLASIARAGICKATGPIKGEVNADGNKIYYLPESSGYTSRITGDRVGERRFCEEGTALDKGWILAK